MYRIYFKIYLFGYKNRERQQLYTFSGIIYAGLIICVEYIKDGTIIDAKIIAQGDTVCIDCNRRNENERRACKMTYHNKVVREFPISNIERYFSTDFDQIRSLK